MSKELKLSKEELVEFLMSWVVMSLSTKGIKEDAKVFDFTSDTPLEARKAEELFGLRLSKEEQLITLYEELTPLNLWIVVFTCENKFSDVKQRNDCLDVFHRRFFDQFLVDTVEDFEQWKRFMGVKYYEYGEAIKTGSGKDLMTLARLIQRNIHRESSQAGVMNFQIMLYVGERMKVLAKALDQYEIK